MGVRQLMECADKDAKFFDAVSSASLTHKKVVADVIPTLHLKISRPAGVEAVSGSSPLLKSF